MVHPEPVSVSSLRRLSDEIADAIGRDRLDRIVASFSPDTVKGLHAYQMYRARAHPLALAWREFQADIERSKRSSALLLSEQTYFLLDHMIRLKQVRNMPGIDRILERIAVPDSYHSALFELYALTEFAAKGAEVEIIEESRVSGKRTPDFAVTMPGGKVFVECKSLDDKSREEERIWVQVESRIIRLLTKARRYWRVGIKAHRIITGRDMEPIVECARRLSLSDTPGSASTPDQAIDVICEPLGSDGWTYGTFDPARTTERGFWEADLHTTNGVNFHRREVMVETEAFFDANEAKRIEGLVQSGYGQIPDGYPGIVLVQIPTRRGSLLLDICDRAFQRVLGGLRSRPRLNAVVLCARTLNQDVRDQEHPIQDYFAVVPNPSPRFTLPEDFEIIGASRIRFPKQSGEIETLDQDLSENEGAVVFQFFVYKNTASQRGRNLFYYCSRDGRMQLRAWQSYQDEFRVDLVRGATGRRTFKSPILDFEAGASHRLGITWAENRLSVGADGRMLTPCDPAEEDTDPDKAAHAPAFLWFDNNTR